MVGSITVEMCVPVKELTEPMPVSWKVLNVFCLSDGLSYREEEEKLEKMFINI